MAAIRCTLTLGMSSTPATVHASDGRSVPWPGCTTRIIIVLRRAQSQTRIRLAASLIQTEARIDDNVACHARPPARSRTYSWCARFLCSTALHFATVRSTAACFACALAAADRATFAFTAGHGSAVVMQRPTKDPLGPHAATAGTPCLTLRPTITAVPDCKSLLNVLAVHVLRERRQV